MTVGSGGGPPNRRGPSLSSGMMIDTVRGVPRARAWPAKRGKPKSDAQAQAVEDFRRSQKLAKRAFPEQQRQLFEATAGTPFMPRDLAVMSMFGRMIAADLDNGSILRGRRVVQDVSESLDLITNQVGSMLVRGPEGWIGFTQAQNFAAWFNNQDYVGPQTPTSSSSWCFKGARMTCRSGASVFRTSAFARYEAGGQYRMLLARINGSREIQELALSPIYEPETTSDHYQAFNCGLELTDGASYALMIGRIDQEDDFAMPVPFANEGWWQCGLQPQGPLLMANTNPQLGDVINAGGSDSEPPMGLMIAI